MPLDAIPYLTNSVLTFGPGGVRYGQELTESWAHLQARVKQGDFAGINIGDYKTITLTTGEEVIMEVAGIDQYYDCGDTAIGHHVDFISRDCLKGEKIFNANGKNNGTRDNPNPWRASDLFGVMNDESSGVYSSLPDELKSCIIEKRAMLERRYSESGDINDSTGWDWGSMGKLWLPTEREVWGASVWSDLGYSGGGGCNIQYPIFIGGAKHIIKRNGSGGSRITWWLSTASRGSSSKVCAVAGTGISYNDSASHAGYRALLCFRIG